MKKMFWIEWDFNVPWNFHSILTCFGRYQKNSHPENFNLENSHPLNTPLENSHPESSHPENPHLEYSHPRFKTFSLEFLIFLFFRYCHRHHWYYLKGCLVILCFKSAEVRNSEIDVSKNLQLARPSLIIGQY